MGRRGDAVKEGLEAPKDLLGWRPHRCHRRAPCRSISRRAIGTSVMIFSSSVSNIPTTSQDKEIEKANKKRKRDLLMDNLVEEEDTDTQAVRLGYTLQFCN